MSVSRRDPFTQIINGDVCSAYHRPALYTRAMEFEPEAGDIIQVAYPRAGSHLVQQMIQLIVDNGESTRTISEFNRRTPYIEFHELQATRAPRLLGTHLPINKLLLSGKAKYVYVARNPWDCCVSNFHMMRDFPAFQFCDGRFDDFLDVFLEGRSGFGDYFDHILSGYVRRREENVFFVTYEEILRDKAGVVLELAHFLGESYGEVVEGNREFMNVILAKSGVDYMRNILKMSRVLGDGLTSTGASVERRSSETRVAEYNVVRKGEVGSWISYFAKESLRRMQVKIDEKFGETDAMTLWKGENVPDKL